MAEKFNSFTSLGKSLNRPEPTESWFEKEDKLLRSQLVQARHNHNKRFEIVTLNKLGTLYRKNSNYDQAIAYFQQTLKLNKEDVFAFDGLGMVYFAMEQYDKAIEWFKKQLDPVIALTNLSRCYYRKGDFQEAIKYAKHVLEKDPTNKIAMDSLAIAYRKQGNHEHSIHWFQERLKIEPNAKHALNGLKKTYAQMGNNPQAINHFKHQLHLKPNDTEAQKYLETISDKLQEQGNLKPAREILNFLQEIVPTESTIREESIQEKKLRLEQEIKAQKANMLSSQKMSMVGAMTAGGAGSKDIKTATFAGYLRHDRDALQLLGDNTAVL